MSVPGTGASGTYTSPASLPTGTYFARTSNGQGFIDLLYNGIACPASNCTITTGTPISVTSGAATSNINFALVPGGKISGIVTNATTGLPVSGVGVTVLSGTGSFAAFGLSDASGNFTTSVGLLTGTYFARTSNSLSYVDQVYSNLACPGGNCTVTSGTPISVTAGATTNNINFALVPGGVISGTVTNTQATTLSGVSVSIYNSAGSFVGSGLTTVSGQYNSPGLPTGTYFARTSNSQGYIEQLYNGATCLGSCLVTAGTPISVTAGAPTSNVNFALAPGAVFRGTVTNASTSAALANVSVQLYNAGGAFITSLSTNTSGNYTTLTGIPAGTYFARTFNSQGFLDELYNDIPCTAQCNPTTGTPIPLPAGVTTTIDFALVFGGRISGSVTSAANNSSLANVSVQVYDAAGSFVTSVSTGTSGNYTTSSGLSTGMYFARTSNSQGFFEQLYNNISCASGCINTTGTPIAVTAGATTSNINFALASGGRISGTVTNATTNGALGGVSVSIYNSAGNFVAFGSSDALGVYTSSQGLPTGTYFAFTSNSLGFVDQLYNNIACSAFTTGAVSGGNICSITAGTAITVTSGVTTGNINFALTPGGGIAGVVTNAATSAGISNVVVQVYDAVGHLVKSGFTDGSGHPASLSGLPTGIYFARTRNSQGLVDGLYNGLPCVGNCVVTTGTPISVTVGATTNNINFALAAGGLVSGSVTNAATNASLANVAVQLYDSTGSFVTSVSTGVSGNYTTSSGVPTGTYFARTSNALGFVDKLYNDIPCVGCNVTTGTPISLAAGATTGNINFALVKAPTVITVAATNVTSFGATLNGTVNPNGSSTTAVFQYGLTTGYGNQVAASPVPGSGLSPVAISAAISGLICNRTYHFRAVATSTGSTNGSDLTFTTPACLHRNRVDFDGDGRPDLTVYRPSNGLWSIRKSTGDFGTSQTITLGSGIDVPVPGDYDGDGHADAAVYHPTGLWEVLQSSTGTTVTKAFGLNTDIPVPGDYDGDGRTDFAIYRASAGTWYYLPSSTGSSTPIAVLLGTSGDVPVPGDYDGDGIADVALYRPSTGEWSVVPSTTGLTFSLTLGSGADRPMPEDYDGDGVTDVAVYHPTGLWSIRRSSTGLIADIAFGLNTDVPVAGDYDGDGLADLAIYRPSENTWYIRQSTIGTVRAVVLGLRGDRPLGSGLPSATSSDATRARDIDGDRKTDLAVYRPSEGKWYVLGSADHYATPINKVFGLPTDTPVLGDWDGDGRTDFGVYHRTGQWEVLLSSTSYATGTAANFGLKTDRPVPGDYDGDGRTDYAVYRPSNNTWFLLLSSTNYTTTLTQVWGAAGDVPVPGDYDGDGQADFAVYRRATGTWLVRLSSTGATLTKAWGGLTDVPVPGDYDGDGKTDLGVYHLTGQWEILLSGVNYTTSTAANFGLSTDIPKPGDYDGDGRTDYAVWRPVTGQWFLLLSSTNYTTTDTAVLGLPTDQAVPGANFSGAIVRTDATRAGDYDGDGQRDVAVYTPAGGWVVRPSSTNYSTSSTFPFGTATDKPVPGDYDGDGRTDYAIFRPSDTTWYVSLSSTNFATLLTKAWGVATDLRVPGDYDGDGKTDIAVYHTGVWQILKSSTNFTTNFTVTLGIAGDRLVPGDYDGDGKTDVGVYRPSEGKWYLLFSSTTYPRA